MTTVAQLVELLEKLPANAEVNLHVREVTPFGSELYTVEKLDLTPLPGLKPQCYSAEDVMCLSTNHIEIKDTRKITGMAPLHKKVVVTIGGEIESTETDN